MRRRHARAGEGQIPLQFIYPYPVATGSQVTALQFVPVRADLELTDRVHRPDGHPALARHIEHVQAQVAGQPATGIDTTDAVAVLIEAR